jgi:outer membrane receptor protein involved in Fe transport
VSGRVVDDENRAIPGANVLLRTDTDSTLVKGAATDSTGRFVIRSVQAGTYRLQVTFVGYDGPVSTSLVLTGEPTRDVGTIVLRPSEILLDDVVVAARRPLFEQRSDRLVVNVRQSATLAGADALQVLQRSPGVIVNEQAGAVTLLGKSGVQVLVNGRPVQVPPDALVQYFAGLNANAIERVELITSPPASMDAEGDAGFINIVLRQSSEEGVRGSLSATGGYGEAEVGSANAELSAQSGDLRLFGGYSFSWTDRETTLTNVRRIDDERGVTWAPSVSDRDPLQRNHNARFGLDLALSPRTQIGTVLAGYDNRWTMTASTVQRTERNDLLVRRTRIDTEELNRWQHLMGNVHAEHRRASGGTVSVDADYLYYRNENTNDYTTTSRGGAADSTTTGEAATRKTTPFRIGVVKADYTAPVSSNWTLGTGVKISEARFTNDVQTGLLLPSVDLGRNNPSENSRLTESVYAAYVESDVQITPQISLNGGLRLERAVSTLAFEESSRADPGSLDRRANRLFPSLTYSHDLSERQQVNASYTRRITRPSFNDRAPFVFFIDPNTFFTGNPGLRPSVSTTLKVDYTRGGLFSSLQYVREAPTISRFQNQIVSDGNLQRIVPVNFDGREALTALVARPIQLTSWWESENNVFLSWQRITRGEEGAAGRLRVGERSHRSIRLRSTQRFGLPHGFAVEASGMYQSADLFGFVRFDPTWKVDVAIEQSLSDRWGRLTLAVSDVFNSNMRTGTTGSREGSTYVERTVDFSPRTLRLTYSLPFGRGPSVRTPATASEEERQRVQ